MNKLLNTLGLAMRAGKIISGEDLVIREIRSKKAKIVILATDTARNTEKKISDKCQFYQVPMIRFGTRQELGNAIGKTERVVIAVTDFGFAKMIQQLVQ
ncbi:YlxQ family RNA-binding protein [Thermoflavimicrobium daqui]|uniref:Ribosomal protein eL8/eL30/eS12/Gadd45 domain-containing protein n=1 Tax=Thermoflavimicrobium daqui TaxID=2137476 RepID=A0A364K7Y0_9BACL|nr:YlxQ family RNA-binding protein [Thermoflavimicrobium daqui]RAL26332.1 hypothetical protein DL897_04870 [Thermoflavimicrobium daqui]